VRLRDHSHSAINCPTWRPTHRAIKLGVSLQINAISTIIAAVVSTALFIAWRLGAFRNERGSVVVEDGAPA
jgi:hypothetical protein